jgi:hypothetical protein
MQYIIYDTKLRLISGVDLYRLLFFVSGLLILNLARSSFEDFLMHHNSKGFCFLINIKFTEIKHGTKN